MHNSLIIMLLIQTRDNAKQRKSTVKVAFICRHLPFPVEEIRPTFRTSHGEIILEARLSVLVFENLPANPSERTDQRQLIYSRRDRWQAPPTQSRPTVSRMREK
jgi:hypothetical protein